jgi:hypothetical protein
MSGKNDNEEWRKQIRGGIFGVVCIFVILILLVVRFFQWLGWRW